MARRIAPPTNHESPPIQTDWAALLEPEYEWDGWDVGDAGGYTPNLPAILADGGFSPVEVRRDSSDALAGINFSTVRPAYALPIIQPKSKAELRRKKKAVTRAALLSNEAIRTCEEYIALHSRSPESDLLKLRLSVRAGMRVSEISDLPIKALADTRGHIYDTIRIFARKTGTHREIAMHPEIRAALENLLKRHPRAVDAAFSISRDGTLRHQKAANLANWFRRLFKAAGLQNCSSHSGRRTFATEVARKLGVYGGSTKDLQEVLGHKCLSSTECYLEPSDRIGEMIRSLGR